MVARQAPRTDIQYHEDGPDHIVIDEVLHRTADGRACTEDDKDGRWFYAAPGTRISRAEAEAVGILSTTTKKPTKPKKPQGTK